MLTAAAIAINIHHGLAESSPGFAISYALSRAVLVIEYIRAGIHIPSARLLTNSVASGFAIAAFLWLISARYCKIRSQFRFRGAVVLLAIAIFGKGLLPVTVIALVAVVSAVQVVQDLYQSRPTIRLVDPEI